jgi:hypothetical protein
MDGELEIEAGVPVAAVADGDDVVKFGVLPAGVAWAKKRGLEWDSDGDRWVCRMEVYNTDPHVEPDMNNWETDLAFKLA